MTLHLKEDNTIVPGVNNIDTNKMKSMLEQQMKDNHFLKQALQREKDERKEEKQKLLIKLDEEVKENKNAQEILLSYVAV